MEYSNGYCDSCKENRKIERPTVNHTLHLLITVILGLFTFGVGSIVWIIVWVMLSLKGGGVWRCSTCGSIV